MSEGLNDLERALRQLQPATTVTGPMLFAMGRASALRSVRIWRGATLASALAAIGLGGMLLCRPEAEVRIVTVPVPALRETTPPSDPVESGDPSDPSDRTASMDTPIPEWRLQHQHVGLRSEPLSDPADAAAPRRLDKAEPLRVGDFLKGPLVWLSISTMGER
jgi:hypothetical protein